MALDNLIKNLLQESGMYRLLVELLTDAMADTIDRNKTMEAVTDAIANDGTFYDVLKAYVKSTEDVSDDELPAKIKEYERIFVESIESISEKPLLDAILGIKLGEIDLGEITIPDFNENPDDNYTLRDVIVKILSWFLSTGMCG